jgi:hypothetical protein
VDAARHHLLARAVLAEDEHAAVRGRRGADLLAQARERRALPEEDRPGDRFAQGAVALLEAALPQGVGDDERDLLEAQRLLDEVEGPQLGRLDGGLDGRWRGRRS